ncbi:L-lactate dehydrogenase [Streptomyces alboniger]
MNPTPRPFKDYQDEIYLNGLGGVVPAFPMTYAELESRARAALPPSVLSYVAGGAGDERTQDANVTAFERWGLVPRMFVGAAERDLSVDLFGVTLPSPLFMAPIGVLGICAQDGHGDLATARAAARTGVPMIASTLSADPMEAVAAEFGDTPGFFQLYTPTDRALAESLVRRAEKSGFKAIVVTMDTWITGWRPRDLSTANFPQLRGHCLANYTSDPVFRAQLPAAPEEDVRSAVWKWVQLFGNPLTWDDLPWLRSLTSLPLIVKGLCHPEDVRRAKDGGVDGVYCSNHGAGRPTAGCPRSTCSPRSSRPPTGCPSSSTRGCAAARTSSRRSHSGRLPSGWAARTRTVSASAGRTVSRTSCARCSPRRTCSWRSTVTRRSRTSRRRRCDGSSEAARRHR